MKRRKGKLLQIVLMLMTVVGLGMSVYANKSWLAALPLYDPGMTSIRLSLTSADEVGCSIARAISPHLEVHGKASSRGVVDLSLRYNIPLQLAPAFLAAEVSSSRITGYLTLFFGPVSIDLGRSWIQSERWGWVQLVVHPRLTFVAGVREMEAGLQPQIGWRLFPTATAAWEFSLLITPNAVSLTLGGVR